MTERAPLRCRDVTAGFEVTTTKVPDERTGPAEVQCRRCGLLAIPLYMGTRWRIRFKLDEGDITRHVPLGGYEEWFCFLCRRKLVAEWGDSPGPPEGPPAGTIPA